MFIDNVKSFLKEHYVIIIILLLATFFRFYNPEFFFINGDVGNVILGSTSKGWLNSIYLSKLPVYFLLLLSPLQIIKSIYFSVILFTLLNILSVFIIYKIGNDFFDKRTGIISSFLYSIFYYSATMLRGSLYNSFIVPPFVLLGLYFMLSAFKGGESVKTILALFLWILILFIHPVIIVFMPIFLIIYFLFSKEIKTSYLIIIAILSSIFILDPIISLYPANSSLLTTLSQLINTISKHFMRNTGSMINYLGNIFSWKGNIPLHVFNVNYCLSYNNISDLSIPFIHISFFLLKLLFLGGISLTLFKKYRDQENSNSIYIILTIIFLYLVFLPILASGAAFLMDIPVSVAPRHLIPVLPLIFIVIGFFVSEFPSIINRRVNDIEINKFRKGVITICLIAIIAIPQMYLSFKILNNETCLTGSAKKDVAESLVNDFCIQDYRTYRKNVNYAGFSWDLGINRHGIDSLFYLEDKNQTCTQFNSSKNILVGRDDSLESIIQSERKLNVYKRKELGRATIISYDRGEKKTELGNHTLFKGKFEANPSEKIKMKVEKRNNKTLVIRIKGNENYSSVVALRIFFERQQPIFIWLRDKGENYYNISHRKNSTVISLYLEKINLPTQRPKNIEDEVKVVGIRPLTKEMDGVYPLKFFLLIE